MPLPQTKRARTQEEQEKRPLDLAGDESSDGQDPSLAVHSRACIRCKTLKVKCEVKSIEDKVTDPCRRCSNGGYDCVLPGRKKRRAPPCVSLRHLPCSVFNHATLYRKRQDLLKQIEEQQALIKQLQERLRESGASAS
jgi:hypothetical protein